MEIRRLPGLVPWLRSLIASDLMNSGCIRRPVFNPRASPLLFGLDSVN
jgi:hypothetical protein